MDGKLRSIGERIKSRHRQFRGSVRAQASSVNTLVVVGTTLFVGIFVLGSIGDAMPTGGMFSDAMNQTTNIIGSSFELAAILPLVIIAAALLFWVRRFNRGGGGDGRR